MRLGRTQLRLRSIDVDRRGDIRREPILSELQGRAIDGDRIGKQLGLVVEPAQIDVVARQFRVQLEPGVSQRIGAGLGVGVRRVDEVAHPPPDVDLVRCLGGERVVSVIGRLVGGAKGAIGRLLVGQKVRNAVDLGIRVAQRGVGARDGSVIGGDRGGEIGVGRVDLCLKIVERSIVEAEPPLPVRRKRRRRPPSHP